MSDIRFKIAGDSTPFIATLCSGGVVLDQQLIEYSGVSTAVPQNYSTVFFGGLNENTTYQVGVEDSVGRTTGFTATTPVNPVVVIPDIEVNLPGSIYVPPPIAGCYECINDELEISPALSGNKCMRICMCTCADATSGDDACTSIYCRPNGSGSWNKIIFADALGGGTDDDDNDFIMRPGDRLCYDMRVSIEHNPATQSTSDVYACIEMDSAVSVGSETISITCNNTDHELDLFCQTTTTTTSTTQSPVKVFFDNVTITPTFGGEGSTGTANLATDPPLSSLAGSPTFNLRIVLRASYANTGLPILGGVSSCASLDTPLPNVFAEVDSEADTPPITREEIVTRTVSAANIDNFDFSYYVNDTFKNNLIPHSISACVCLDSIPSSTGGYNFQIGNGTNEKCIGFTNFGEEAI